MNTYCSNKNAFGHISELILKTEYRQGRTIISDLRFTAPFKVMKPFERKDGSISIMLQQASAGILDGDSQHFHFEIGPGSRVEFTSQSYDKIHPMQEHAERLIEIEMSHGTVFSYSPQPLIPFKDSDFRSRLTATLEDNSSLFLLSDILTCGRLNHNNEKFKYRMYSNLVNVRRSNRLIYRDNTKYCPSLFQMDDIGLYESYTHLLNMYMSNCPDTEKIRSLIADCPEHTECAMSVTKDNGLAIRAFASRSQDLENISDSLRHFLTHL